MVEFLVGRKHDFVWKRELASLVSVSGLDCEHGSRRSRGGLVGRPAAYTDDLYWERCDMAVTLCDANKERLT